MFHSTWNENNIGKRTALPWRHRSGTCQTVVWGMLSFKAKSTEPNRNFVAMHAHLTRLELHMLTCGVSYFSWNPSFHKEGKSSEGWTTLLLLASCKLGGGFTHRCGPVITECVTIILLYNLSFKYECSSGKSIWRVVKTTDQPTADSCTERAA